MPTPASSAIGFGGFVGSARVDVSQIDGDHISDGDGDAFLHLKRLAKKDQTTKLKALAALTLVFKHHPAAELSTLLPRWVFEYKRLVQDNSRQVRQSTHVAMGSLANSVGRGLAPYLRSLMGPWWVAQFDSSREVCEAAKASFQTAFPKQKRRLEALMFCENEIFQHVIESFKFTPQTISDKSTPIEESTEKYERVVSCSLLALASLVDVFVGPVSSRPGEESAGNVVDRELAAKMKEIARKEGKQLYCNHKFLQQFLTAKSSRIRSATYQAMRSFIEHLPELFGEQDIDVAAPAILGTFSEKDPSCHQPMWDMVLLFANGFPQAWSSEFVQNSVFPRLWSFLRHGCYGSQEISYRNLLLLISLIPPQAIVPAQSFLGEFFSSLWHGRLTSLAGPTTHDSLLKCIQDCLIWTVRKAKRFSDVEGYPSVDLQIAILHDVLLKLLWYDYVGASSSQKLALPKHTIDTSSLKVSSESSVPSKPSSSTMQRDVANQFTEKLGSCIVETLKILSGFCDEGTLAFWKEFQKFCFQIVQEAGDHWQSGGEEDNRITRIADFFMLLGRKRLKGESWEQWSLVHAVRPFIATSFPAIMSLGHPESIRLIAKLTTMYGPTVFLQLSLAMPTEKHEDKGHDGPQLKDLEDDESLVQYFRKQVLPWCLDGADELNDSKVEVVLAFIQNQRFQKDWELLLIDITTWQEDKEDGVDVKQVGVLATLLEKIRENKGWSSGKYDNTETRNHFDRWRCARIDDAAVVVSASRHLAHPACSRFLRSCLGGTSSEEESLPLLSDKASIQVLENILKRMLRVLSASAIKWIRSAPAVITRSGASDSSDVLEHPEISEDDLILGASAINVLGNCIFALPILNNGRTVGEKLLASIFCLNWGYSHEDMIAFEDGFDSAEEYDSNLDSDEETRLHETHPSQKIQPDLSENWKYDSTLEDEPCSKVDQAWDILREALLTVRRKVTPNFCGNFTALSRFRLRFVLINCLRLAILDEQFEMPQRMAVRCAAWSQEIVGCTCVGPDETSEFVDRLLMSEESWPHWVVAPSLLDKENWRNVSSCKPSGELLASQKQQHDRFVCFVDHLSRAFGPEEVFFNRAVSLRNDLGCKEEAIVVKPAESDSENDFCKSIRIWLTVELLCTWEWSGGSALAHLLPFLCSFASSQRGSTGYTFLWNTIECLFLGSTNSKISPSKSLNTSALLDGNFTSVEDPFLRALLALLKCLLEREDGWSTDDARDVFRRYVVQLDAIDLVSSSCGPQILPLVLSVLMPHLRRRSIKFPGDSMDEEWQSFLQTAVSVWLQKAISGPPLVVYSIDTRLQENPWTRVAVSCFPLNNAGGVGALASAISAQVTSQERELLLVLFKKQFSREANALVAASAAMDRVTSQKTPEKLKRNLVAEVTLAKLVDTAVGYCWVDFGTEEWEFTLKCLRRWVQETVIEVEEFTESMIKLFNDTQENCESEDSVSEVTNLNDVLPLKGSGIGELSSIGVAIFSLLKGLCNLEGVDSTDSITKLKVAGWENLEMRILEDILRVMLAIGLAESSTGKKGGNLVALHRMSQVQLWDNVSDVALNASNQAREAAIRAIDLWGVGRGAVSSLYALLFSAHPTISLQWVAYQYLSGGQILHLAVTRGIVLCGESESNVDEVLDEGEGKVDEGKGDPQDFQPAIVAQIRSELSSVLEAPRKEILNSPVTSTLRVSYLLGWSLLLTRLQSLTALSSTRERLVQYVQDSDISPTLLDCLFQHIPLEQNSGTSASRKRSLGAVVKTSSAAAPAKRAAATGSVCFAVEELWPVQEDGLVTLCGALYGLMLLVLPACVRIWFTGLRDKSLASAIEFFTTTHCSPQLLADEFGQVQASAVDDENLSIRANRSLREVTAVYKKEEVGMDIVIRIPSCYPLRAVDVECTRRMGINETLHRKWILSMASFLRNQNGAVAEAVQMWKKNVDREFEGVEECPICYSIIHTSNHHLPRLACKTCRHKFHSACLYKWFSTSHQSTCPLCKTPF